MERNPHMNTAKMKRLSAFAGAAVFSTMALAACGDDGATAGGDTTCKEFIDMDAEQRRAVITDFAKEDGEDLDDISADEFDMGNDFIAATCEMVSDSSIKLRDISEDDIEVPDLEDLDIPELEDLEDLDLD